MKAVILNSWEEVNEYFDTGWFYVDSKIIGKKFYFILTKDKGNRVTINRSRK